MTDVPFRNKLPLRRETKIKDQKDQLRTQNKVEVASFTRVIRISVSNHCSFQMSTSRAVYVLVKSFFFHGLLACVASVSVWFRSKERPRNGIFVVLRVISVKSLFERRVGQNFCTCSSPFFRGTQRE